MKEHAALSAIGSFWLASARGCRVVLVDARSPYNEEHPDVIGWDKTGHSHLIEVKSTRKDFLSEKSRQERKAFRFREACEGMGAWRVYLCRPRVIMPEDVIDTGWGLAWAYGADVIQKVGATFQTKRNQRGEIILLAAARAPAREDSQLTLPKL